MYMYFVLRRVDSECVCHLAESTEEQEVDIRYPCQMSAKLVDLLSPGLPGLLYYLARLSAVLPDRFGWRGQLRRTRGWLSSWLRGRLRNCLYTWLLVWLIGYLQASSRLHRWLQDW